MGIQMGKGEWLFSKGKSQDGRVGLLKWETIDQTKSD